MVLFMKKNKQMINAPKRHHYIPQFILKNFCNDGQHIYYYDAITKQISLQDKANVFMERNFYCDEINYPTMPVQIEKDLAKYESEVAIIIKNILDNNEIIISKKDYDSLLLFFAIMSFRSKNANDTLNDNASYESKEFFKFWQNDGNLTDFWKRNLGIIAKCRSIEEVSKSEADDPIKAFMIRDTFGFTGKYIMIFERRGNEEFVITDCYPVHVTGTLENGQSSFEMPMFDYFPISPNRLLVFACNGVEYAPDDVRIFDKKIIKKPILLNNNYVIKVKKIYEQQVKLVNDEAIKLSKIGIAFRNINSLNLLPIDIADN